MNTFNTKLKMRESLRTVSLLTVMLTTLFGSTVFSQSPCNLSNFTGAYTLNANDYPYFSPGSGVTVSLVNVGVPTLNNFSYNCNGQSFATVSPAFWINAAAPTQSLTFNFSDPVCTFSIVVNGTNQGEEFYFTPATGSVQLSDFCTAGFTATGGGASLLCTQSAATGTLITVNNPVGSTSYTLTHNGTGSGSRYALIDCFVLCSAPGNNFVSSNYCEGDSTLFDPTFLSTPDSVLWNFDDPLSGLNNISTDTMPSHVFTSPGTYDVSMIWYIGGVPDTVTNSVTINPSPIVTASNTGPYCEGQPISISETGGSASSWSWSSSGSAIITTNVMQSPSVSGAVNGEIFTVIGTDANGCSDTAQTIIVINPIPNVNATNDGPYCFGDTIQLNEIGGDGASWSWTTNGFGTIVTNSVQDPYVTNAINGEIFTVVVTSINGCTNSDTTLVLVNLPPAVTASSIGPYCEGDSILLTETDATGVSWFWTTSGSATIINPNVQNTYASGITSGDIFTVNVIDGNGCENSDTTVINLNPLPIVIASNMGPYCLGDNVQVTENGGELTSWMWTSNGSASFGNNFLQTTQASGAGNGEIFVVIGADANGCENSDTTTVVMNPLPWVYLGEDTTVCEEDPYILDVTAANGSYLWQDSSTNSSYSVISAGTYWVIVTVNGCSSSDEINIELENCEALIEMPNVFTPNNDGANDIFTPVSMDGVISMNTTILNRWGNVVFQTNNPLIEWDGGNLKEGTYTWIVKYVDMNGESFEQHGFVTLRR